MNKKNKNINAYTLLRNYAAFHILNVQEHGLMHV